MILTIAEDSYSAKFVFLSIIQNNQSLRNRFFRSCKAHNTIRVGSCLYVLDQLEVHKRENEGFGVKDDHKHVFPEFDIADYAVERNFGPILTFEIIPNDHFVSGS